jgi:hypothetical protein
METETLVRVVGVLALLMVVYVLTSVAAGFFAPDDEKNAKGEIAGISNMPALAMEFASDAREVDNFLGKRVDGDSAMRRKIRRALAWDNFYIPLYWLVFVGMSVLFSRRGWPAFAFWLAALAVLCATGAAISDYVENARTRTLLDAAAVTEPLVRAAASASFWKWLLIAVATLALSPLFLWAGGEWQVWAGRAAFLLYALGGLLIVCGLLGGRARLVQAGFFLSGIGAVVPAVLFVVWPGVVAPRL